MNFLSKVFFYLKSKIIIEYARTIIDISKWQCSSDGTKLFNFDIYEKSDGIFIIVKASEGTHRDIRYDYYMREILSRELAFGTYYFGNALYDPRDSARYWAKQINALPEDSYKSARKITRHWLDIERRGFSNVGKVYGRWWVREFLDEIDKLTNVKIGIYTSHYGWIDNVAYMGEIHERDLWLADYDSLPEVPPDWADFNKTWLMHQECVNCTSCGACGKDYGAVSISIDKSKFHGNRDDFYRWLLPEGEEELSSKEYDELLSIINSNIIRIENLESAIGSPHFYIEMGVTATAGLVLRDFPEGNKVVTMPYNSKVLGSDNLIPDSLGRGYWREIKYLDYVGWSANWYLYKV